MLKLLWAAIAGGSPLSWGIGALVIALTIGSAFGGGWYVGDTHSQKVFAKELAVAGAKAAKAQADQDARDWAKDKADYEKRLAQKNVAEVKYITLFKNRKVLVPNPTKCFAPAASLKSLNDPALVGETQ